MQSYIINDYYKINIVHSSFYCLSYNYFGKYANWDRKGLNWNIRTVSIWWKCGWIFQFDSDGRIWPAIYISIGHVYVFHSLRVSFSSVQNCPFKRYICACLNVITVDLDCVQYAAFTMFNIISPRSSNGASEISKI